MAFVITGSLMTPQQEDSNGREVWGLRTKARVSEGRLRAGEAETATINQP